MSPGSRKNTTSPPPSLPPLPSIARSANSFASTRLGRSTDLRAGYATSNRLVWSSLCRMRQLSLPSQALKRHLVRLEVGDAYSTVGRGHDLLIDRW